MPYALYVCAQDDNKIIAFAMDADTGQLTPQAELPVAGGPSVMAISPDRRTLYVGQRTGEAISSFRIDPGSGGLTLLGSISQAHAPTFLAPDRAGRYLLSAYYQGGGAAVYRLGAGRRGWRAVAGLVGHGHRRPRHPDRSAPTGLPLCRTSPASKTMFWNRQRIIPAQT